MRYVLKGLYRGLCIFVQNFPMRNCASYHSALSVSILLAAERPLGHAGSPSLILWIRIFQI